MLNNLITTVFRFVINLPGDKLKNKLRDYFYGDVISERIVEYALCFANLDSIPSKHIKVMDIGCYYSNFPIQLASMGYDVTGIDMMNYELKHPNFRFLQGDITKLNFGKNKFDIITCISTLEHIGLSVYGDDLDLAADEGAVNRMYSLLKPGGAVLVTVPFGKNGRTETYKSYDWKDIKMLFKNFKKLEVHFYREKSEKWLPVTLGEASKISNKKRAKAIVFVKARKG